MPVKIRKKLLAQRMPSTTTATLCYRPPDGKYADIKSIVVCNQSSAAVSYSIYVDKNASVAANGTALFGAVSLAANSTVVLTFDGECGIVLETDTAGIFVKSSTASSLTFTLFGLEIEET